MIKFWNAQSIAPIEIHRQLCQVYGPNVMSEQMVRHWCRQFSAAGRQSVHDEKRSGRPSIITDDLVELVRECIMENLRFTITELSSHFPLLVGRNCHGAPGVQEIVRQVGAEATDTRTQNKAHGVSIDISAAVP
jgi:transposase